MRARAPVCVSLSTFIKCPSVGEALSLLGRRRPRSRPRLSRVRAERRSPYCASQILQRQVAGARAGPAAPNAAGRSEDVVLRVLRPGTAGDGSERRPELLPDRRLQGRPARGLASPGGGGAAGEGARALSPPAAGRAGSSVRGAGPPRSRDSEGLEEKQSLSAPESHYIQIFILGAIP